MNLVDCERLATRVVTAEPGSVTESQVVEQLVEGCHHHHALGIMDALIRVVARAMLDGLPPGTDLHEPGLAYAHGDNATAKELEVVDAAASYACGHPDHAYTALLTYHDTATTPAEATVNLAALIRVAKAAHAGNIKIRKESA